MCRDDGGLIDSEREARRTYVRAPQEAKRRLEHGRRITEDLKAQLEEELKPGQLHRLVLLLGKAGGALRTPTPGPAGVVAGSLIATG